MNEVTSLFEGGLLKGGFFGFGGIGNEREVDLERGLRAPTRPGFEAASSFSVSSLPFPLPPRLFLNPD